jgi:lipopolysaccharide export system protein LptA
MTMRNGSFLLLSGLAALMLAAANATQAQPSNAPPSNAPPNALQGFSQNRDQPVNIQADALEVRNQKKVATYSGHVHLVQGDTTLRCNTLIVYYDGDQAGGQAPAAKSAGPAPPGGGNIRYMEAIGQVIVVQRDQTATGEKAVYDMKTNSVVLSAAKDGFVTVTQGPNVVSGPRLVVHLDTGVSHFEGGRIKSLFVPGSNKGGDAKPSPAADAKAAPAQPAKPHSSQPSNLY